MKRAWVVCRELLLNFRTCAGRRGIYRSFLQRPEVLVSAIFLAFFQFISLDISRSQFWYSISLVNTHCPDMAFPCRPAPPNTTTWECAPLCGSSPVTLNRQRWLDQHPHRATMAWSLGVKWHPSRATPAPGRRELALNTTVPAVAIGDLSASHVGTLPARQCKGSTHSPARTERQTQAILGTALGHLVLVTRKDFATGCHRITLT